MDHFGLSDELRQKLMESAAWNKADISPRIDEAAEAVEEAPEDVIEESHDEEYEEDVHVCPLCVSQLDEAIDEERILEHLNVVVGLVERLSQLHEGEEDVETVIDETIAELLLQDDEDYDEE